MQTLQIPVSDANALGIYLRVMNPFMSLTDMELKVLEAFIQAGSFDLSARQEVLKTLRLKSQSSVNNYIKSLKDKQVLLVTNGSYSVHPRIKFDREGVTFLFTHAG